MKSYIAFWQDGVLKGRHAEDYYNLEPKSGTFVVADGVSLWKGVEYEGNYPTTSGAHEVSKVFCNSLITFFNKNSKASLKEGFVFANEKVKEVNKDRSKFTVFRDHKGLFAATAALMRIKDMTLEWAQICDSGIAVISKEGKIKFRKDECKHNFEWPVNARSYDPDSGTFFGRTLLANAIDKKGKRMGYGVVNGEKEAINYLEYGTRKLIKGDTVVLYTDGFEPFFALPEFLNLLASIDSREDAKKDLEIFVNKCTEDDRQLIKGKKINMKEGFVDVVAQLKKLTGKTYSDFRFSKEKTLIAVKI